MSRKNGYIPMEKRIVNLANLVELNNIESNNPVDIARYNALEEALAIIENREPVIIEKDNSTFWGYLNQIFHSFKSPLVDYVNFFRWRKKDGKSTI